MADTEFDDTSVDSERFNDDSDRSRNIYVDLYDSDGESLPASVTPYERAVDGYLFEPLTPRVTLTMWTIGLNFVLTSCIAQCHGNAVLSGFLCIILSDYAKLA